MEDQYCAHGVLDPGVSCGELWERSSRECDKGADRLYRKVHVVND